LSLDFKTLSGYPRSWPYKLHTCFLESFFLQAVLQEYSQKALNHKHIINVLHLISVLTFKIANSLIGSEERYQSAFR